MLANSAWLPTQPCALKLEVVTQRGIHAQNRSRRCQNMHKKGLSIVSQSNFMDNSLTYDEKRPWKGALSRDGRFLQTSLTRSGGPVCHNHTKD